MPLKPAPGIRRIRGMWSRYWVTGNHALLMDGHIFAPDIMAYGSQLDVCDISFDWVPLCEGTFGGGHRGGIGSWRASPLEFWNVGRSTLEVESAAKCMHGSHCCVHQNFWGTEKYLIWKLEIEAVKMEEWTLFFVKVFLAFNIIVIPMEILCKVPFFLSLHHPLFPCLI